MSQTKEQSIKSSYIVLYELKDDTWVPLGNGGWTEVHLCSDCEDGTFRILAWSVETQDVLLNASVNESCVYKGSKKPNFHSFKSEFGKYGFGFHKAEESIKLANEFLNTVCSVIQQLRAQSNVSPLANKASDPRSTQRHLTKMGLLDPKDFKSLGVLKVLPAKPNKHKNHDEGIFDPDQVKHTRHGFFNHKTQKFEGNFPENFRRALEKQFGVPPKQLVSRKVPGYDAKIPAILLDLKGMLKQLDGYKITGIFRLAPSGKNNEAVKDLIDLGEDWKDQITDVNLCANLLKVWFRELPTPILNQVENGVIEMSQDIASVKKATDLFPEPSRSILLWLWDLCVEVAEYENENKMGAQNLAIVIGPNLFNTQKFSNPMLAMTFSGKVVTFFQRGIEWRQQQKHKS